MKIVDFGQRNCEKVRRYLDSYISNELLVESNLEVLRHIEQCSACSQELETRVRIRTSVQIAARQEEVPPSRKSAGRFVSEAQCACGRSIFRSGGCPRLQPYCYFQQPSGSACAAGENSARRSRMLISGGYPPASRQFSRWGCGITYTAPYFANTLRTLRPSRRWRMRWVRNTPG